MILSLPRVACCMLHLPPNRQLAEVRKASQDRSGGARVVEAEKKLIICAVKKPLKLNESQDGQSRVSRTNGVVLFDRFSKCDYFYSRKSVVPARAASVGTILSTAFQKYVV